MAFCLQLLATPRTSVVAFSSLVRFFCPALQLSSLAIFFAGLYGWYMAVLDGLETRFQVSLSCLGYMRSMRHEGAYCFQLYIA